jgi:hypothetical protein
MASGVVTALIDFDEVVYQAGFSSQHTTYRVYLEGEEEYIASFQYKKQAVEWVNDQEDMTIVPEIESETLHIALSNARNYILTILKMSGAHRPIGFFTGPNNFRLGLASILPYKGNRDEAHKPIYYSEIKEYLTNNWESEIIMSAEADDGMSMGQWPLYEEHSTIICTNDKDLNMVPGWRYWPNKKRKALITPLEGCRSFYKQLLSGDTTDNIPGLYKITGRKVFKAKHLNPIDEMMTEEEMYEHCLLAYGDEADKIEEVGNLLWMLRNREDKWVPGNKHYIL